ncbi:hypothetical protein [Sulfurisphaera tokodaii]|uniref:2-keto-4-pentenoate hydratase n=2 Tax=Sulfurisphaera tokodaii TaxID=111955 RepID=F9VML0_SULTO|nr:hypothetical protein [Sulfurisphaera tokodaii]BAK54156.1 hypothetical protein STK_01180 [Sulfurisphaera tokodaii str. 7]HII74129.1 hypothetical protein [Sulfurisphaera tokodaii]
MRIEEKVNLLYNAYKEKKVVEPFEVGKEEAEKIFALFTERLVKDEGFGGYKISFVTPESLNKFNIKEPEYGILTQRMIVKDNNITIPFKYAYAEIEVIVKANRCREDNLNSCISETYLGIEIPMTRFNAPLNRLTIFQLKADDMASGLVYVGERINKQPSEVSLYIDGELKAKGKPNFIYGDYIGMVKWLIKKVGEVSGYISTGSIVGPIPLDKGVKVKVVSEEVELNVKTY